MKYIFHPIALIIYLVAIIGAFSYFNPAEAHGRTPVVNNKYVDKSVANNASSTASSTVSGNSTQVEGDESNAVFVGPAAAAIGNCSAVTGAGIGWQIVGFNFSKVDEIHVCTCQQAAMAEHFFHGKEQATERWDACMASWFQKWEEPETFVNDNPAKDFK